MTEQESTPQRLVSLETRDDFWSRFHMVAPLVVVGTAEGEGYDLAPKHMATPMGWGPYFGFVCTPRHATYQNAKETGFFTVSFLKPSQVVLASITAQPRCGDGEAKPGLEEVPTFRATKVDGVFLEDGYLYLECKTERTIDGFGKNSLVIGYIEAVHVDEAYLRTSDAEEGKRIHEAPLLAYLSPGRYAEIRESHAFPFPASFER